MGARSATHDPGLVPGETSPGGAASPASEPPPAVGAPALPPSGTTFRLSVPAHLSAIRPGVIHALEILIRAGVTDEELTSCELALVEACNNAVLYSADKSCPIEIEITCRADRIELQVIDHTPGFEWPERIELPHCEAEHGRGLFLIRSVMDDVFYLRSRRENRLCLRKQRKLNSGAAAASVEPASEVETRLALSRQVLSSMANELCQQVAQSRRQQEELDNRLLAHELAIARNIQESLLPKCFPQLPGFSVSGFCLSARQVGGDFYDLIELPDGCLLMAVADVMGKGVPAALFAATLRTLLRTATQWTQRASDLLRRINRLMYDELNAVDMFITVQVAIANVREGFLHLASAGHNPLLYLGHDGLPRTTAPDGMPLGILPEVAFEEECIPLQNLGAALLFTDGLTEARSPEGELFGQQRLAQWLVTQREQHHTAAALVDHFKQHLALFQGPNAPRDDQTFLLLVQERDSLRLTEPRVSSSLCDVQ